MAHALAVVAGIALIVLGLGWGVFWYGMSAYTTDSGEMNSATYLAWGIAVVGTVVGVGLGVWLIV